MAIKIIPREEEKLDEKIDDKKIEKIGNIKDDKKIEKIGNIKDDKYTDLPAFYIPIRDKFGKEIGKSKFYIPEDVLAKMGDERFDYYFTKEDIDKFDRGQISKTDIRPKKITGQKIDDKKIEKEEKLADYKVSAVGDSRSAQAGREAIGTYKPKIDASKVDSDRVKVVGTKSLLEEYLDLLYWQ